LKWSLKKYLSLGVNGMVEMTKEMDLDGNAL
jgi:hypothetical protein